MVFMPTWKFLEMQKGDVNRDPIEGQFFSTEALESMADALVREAIQNSLDAAVGGRAVRVRIAFSSPGAASRSSRHAGYFESLWPHLRAPQAGLGDLPDPLEPVHHLVIEDFGTRGLNGDVRQYEDQGDNTHSKNDFYYFWRNVGRSVKESEERGRWGLGKTVFQASSRINAFLGLTTRAEDGRSYVMGQAVLKIHSVGGRRFTPYGYFGEFDGTLPLPIQDPPFLDLFGHDFGVTRRGESGLSVVIPYPDPDIDVAGILRSVIHHYFFPILSGDLVVDVQGNGSSETLDARTLPVFVERSNLFDRHDLGRLLKLARWGLSLQEKDYVVLKVPPPGSAPKLQETLFDSATLDVLRHRFDNEEPIALVVPVTLQHKGAQLFQQTHLRMYLERDAGLERAQDHFIRQGITIADVHSLRTRGVRALVSITDRHLTTFLGDAENPAHTQWERNNRLFKSKYTLAASTLDFVKMSPRNVAQILSKPVQAREEGLLKEFFSLPMGEIAQRTPRPREDDEEVDDQETQSPEVHVDPRTKFLRLWRLQGGFRVSGDPKATSYPPSIAVQMAYEVRRGNPFKRYESLDFEVNKPPIDVRVSGAKIMQCVQNMIQVALEKPGFDLIVTGYDTNRDLRIKTAAVGDTI